MDMLITGMASVRLDCSVAVSSVSTSSMLRGITATLAMSAPSARACANRRFRTSTPEASQ